MEHKPLRGSLHHHRIAPRIRHLSEILLNEITFWGSIGSRYAHICPCGLYSSDKTHLVSHPLQNRFYHICGCCLSLGAVIPIVLSSLAGCPNHAAEMQARAYLESATFITAGRGFPPPSSSEIQLSSSTTRTDAPALATSGANLCPSATAPRMQTKGNPRRPFWNP